MGIDSSENLNIIGIVVGDLRTMNSFYRDVLKAVREDHLHVSKLKRDKKKRLLRYIESIQFPFLAVCIKTRFRSLARTLSTATYMPRKKARYTIMRRLLVKVKDILRKKNVERLEAIHPDNEFSEYEDLFLRVFKAPVEPRNFATELADLIAYLNRAEIERNIVVVKI